MELNDKLKIILTLFTPPIRDSNDNRIDYECINGFSKAFYIASHHRQTYIITKTDMIYINTICDNLIKNLGTENLNNLTKSDIDDKLQSYVSVFWLDSYKKLVKIIL